MHHYSVRAPFKRIATDMPRPSMGSECGNRYLLIAMEHSSKCLQVHTIPNRKASTVANDLTNLCHFRIL